MPSQANTLSEHSSIQSFRKLIMFPFFVRSRHTGIWPNSDILKSANRSDERGETSALKPSELPMSQPEYPLSMSERPLLLFYRCLHRRERRGSGDHCWVSRLQHPVHCWSLWAICRNGEFPFREKKSIHLSTLIYYNKRYHSCEIYIMQLFCTEIGKKIMQNS